MKIEYNKWKYVLIEVGYSQRKGGREKGVKIYKY